MRDLMVVNAERRGPWGARHIFRELRRSATTFFCDGEGPG